MEPNTGNDYNVGGAASDTSSSADSGGAGVDAGVASGNPDGQGGSQSDQWKEKEGWYQGQIKSLNRALVESRRGSRQGSDRNPNGADFSSPEGQYAVAIELAENKLRGNLEKVYGFYPEVPQDAIARVRTNPWAFASRESFLTGDSETAALEIEQYLLELAESLGAANQPSGSAQPNPRPATVNPSPVPEPTPTDSEPGTDEDENPWTMPMGKLERAAKKQLARTSVK